MLYVMSINIPDEVDRIDFLAHMEQWMQEYDPSSWYEELSQYLEDHPQ